MKNSFREELLKEIGFNASEAKAILDTSSISDEELINKTKHLLSLEKNRIDRILSALEKIETSDPDSALFSDTKIRAARKEIKEKIKKGTTETTEQYGEKVTALLKKLGEMHAKKLPCALGLDIVRRLKEEGFSFLYKKGYGNPVPEKYIIANRIGGPGTGKYYADIVSWYSWYLKASQENEEAKRASLKEKLKYDQMAKVARTLHELGAFTPKTAVAYDVLNQYPKSLIQDMNHKGYISCLIRWEGKQAVYDKVYLNIDDVYFEY